MDIIAFRKPGVPPGPGGIEQDALRSVDQETCMAPAPLRVESTV